jgi:multidrug efflux pump subunit AcrA (membrane-fusion protein)
MSSSLLVLAVSLALTGPGDNSSHELNNCLVSLILDKKVPAQESGVIVSLKVREGSQVEDKGFLGQIRDSKAQMAKRVAIAQHRVAEEKWKNDINVRFATKSALVAWKEYEVNKLANDKVPGTKPLTEILKLMLAAERADLQVEQADHERTVAKFEAESKLAEVDAADDDIQRRQILSPLKGEVVEVLLKEGEWANPGDPVLRIVQMDKLRIEGFLSVAKYSPSEIVDRAVRVEVALARNRVETFRGKIVWVDPLVAAGGDYRVWAEVDNRMEAGHWLMRPGLSANMFIDVQGAAARPNPPRR